MEVSISMQVKRIMFLGFIGFLHITLFAYNPPPTGENLYNFTAPTLLSSEVSVAGGPLFHVHPGDISVNPALPAREQRVVIDFAYTAMIHPTGAKKYAQAGQTGVIIPSRVGVFSGIIQAILVPSFEHMQLRNNVSGRFAFSKEITESLFVGIGLLGTYGSDWGVSADIGFVVAPVKFRNLSFMKNARFAFSLTGMGKAYNPKNSARIYDNKKATGFSSFFTPRMGFAGNLFSVNKVEGGISLEASFPAFQNFVFDAGLQFLFADIVRVSTGWQLNLREILAKKASLIPSVSISFKFGFNGKKLGNQGWAQSEMVVSGAYRQFRENTHVASGGVALYLGLKDTAAPEIVLWGNDEE